MGRKIPFDRIIAIGIPVLLSVIGLLLGYMISNVTLLILGWGSVFLTIIFTYFEYKLPSKCPVKGYKILQEMGDPFQQIITQLGSVKKGTEIYSIATVPSYPDYESAYIDAVHKACNGVNGNKVICVRIISNQEKHEEMRNMYFEMSDFTGKYTKLRDHREKIKIIKMDKGLGLDALVIADARNKLALLGVKEMASDSYFNGIQGKHIDRGNTYVFENDEMAESLYRYFVNFVNG